MSVPSHQRIELLRCPETGSALHFAAPETLEEVSKKGITFDDATRAKEKNAKLLTGGLVTSDGKRFYPILDGIPKMLRDDAIDLELLGFAETVLREQTLDKSM